MLDGPRSSAYALTASKGLRFIQLSGANGLNMFLCMLSHTMFHIGALEFNPQNKLIDSLMLMNGNDVYEFMALVLEVNKFIEVSHIYPSPNTLIIQITNELSKSPEHCLAISDIKSVLFSLCVNTPSTRNITGMMYL